MQELTLVEGFHPDDPTFSRWEEVGSSACPLVPGLCALAVSGSSLQGDVLTVTSEMDGSGKRTVSWNGEVLRNGDLKGLPVEVTITPR